MWVGGGVCMCVCVFEMSNDLSTMFMDLTKVFGTLNHNSLITKFGAYGFERLHYL